MNFEFANFSWQANQTKVVSPNVFPGDRKLRGFCFLLENIVMQYSGLLCSCIPLYYFSV